MLTELEQRTRPNQTQEGLRSRVPEVVALPIPSLKTLIVSEGIGNRLNPFERVQFITQEGQKISFQATNKDGKELVERVVTRVFEQYGARTDWQNLAEQAESLSSAFKPLRKEFKAQLEVAQALFSEPFPYAACIASLGAHFETSLKRFTREGKNGQRELTAGGKRFAEATYQWLIRLFPETETDELKEVVKTNLGETADTGLLRRSLLGKINWENKQRQYLVLEQQNPEELFQPKYYNEFQKELQGAARFQYELGLVIKKDEQKLGREVDAQAEIQVFETILEVEANALEEENKQLMAEVAQKQPQGFREKVKAGWDRFTNWFIKEKGYKKVALATVSAVSLGVVLATCAGIPQQRLFGQESLLPNPPGLNPDTTVKPNFGSSQVAISAAQPHTLAESLAVRVVTRSDLISAEQKAEKQKLLALTADNLARNQEAMITQPVVETKNKVSNQSRPASREKGSFLSTVEEKTGVVFDVKQIAKDKEQRKGPPPPINPTPEPTAAQKEIRAQAEPTLIITGVPHNADLNSDPGIFEARCTWVKLAENGQLPEPPKDKVPLYDVGFLYGQTPEGKAHLVAAEGDVHAYIHNALPWAEADWPKWKDWLSLAFDQGGIKIGKIIEFGGAKYQIIRIDPFDPHSMLADLFAPTKEFMGRRLVISTCSTPPEGVLTGSTQLGLPRQVVTAVLVNETKLAEAPPGVPTA